MKSGRALSSRIVATILSLSLGIVAFPKLQGEKTVRAAWEKNQENTRIGVSQIGDPLVADNAENPWYGSYVYYGKYGDSPILFRVLDTDATDFNTNPTLLLDSDRVLTEKIFDGSSSTWENSALCSWLNGDFLSQFTSAERYAIAKSQVDSRAQANPYPDIGNYVALDEMVFLLDYDDVMNTNYGYYPDNGIQANPSQVKNRIKYNLSGDAAKWWLRTNWTFDEESALLVSSGGYIDPWYFTVNNMNGVAPAMNIDTNMIAFSSAVEGDYGKLGTNYKLTLFDNDIFIQIPDGEQILPLGNNQYSVPYKITGADADKVNRLSLVITSRDGKELLYYSDITPSGTLKTSSYVAVTIPDSITGVWGDDYLVNVAAEIVNDQFETDYCGTFLSLYDPDIVFDLTSPMTFNTSSIFYNGVFILIFSGMIGPSSYTNPETGNNLLLLDVDKDGTNDIALEDLGSDLYMLSKLPDRNIRKKYDVDTSSNVSLSRYKFTFVFEPFFISIGEVEHGTVSSSMTTAFGGEKIKITATPDAGYVVDTMKLWRQGSDTPIDLLSTGGVFDMPEIDVNVEVTFKPIDYSIAVTTDGNGSASASATTAHIGDVITLTATPNAGYQFKEWQVVSGDVTITENSFTVGAANVEIKAIFELIPTPDPVKEPSFEDFIERMYVVALNRASEPDGKAFWMDKIKNDGFTGGRVAIGFLIEAPEFLNRGLSDEQFVDVLYKTFFDREADADGKAFWMGHLATDMTREQVVRGFIDSTEWCNLCAYYGVKSGAPNAKAEKPSNNALKFATRLYTECLGRDPEADGLQFWALRLTNLESTGYEAARGFFESQEFQNKNVDDETYVKLLYRTFMGRDYDQGGLEFWLGHLSTDMNRLQVLQGFAQSQEFTNICNDYGIDRGTI